jgi:hypothetical protein
MSLSEIFDTGVPHPWANFLMNNVKFNQYSLNNFADATVAVGISQSITGGVQTQLTNFTGEFGNLGGMNLLTGVFSPNLVLDGGIYIWSIQFVITGLVAPSNIIIYFYDGPRLIIASTQYLVNDGTSTAYAYNIQVTALFDGSAHTLNCQVLCPDNITINGIWGIQKLYGIPSEIGLTWNTAIN